MIFLVTSFVTFGGAGANLHAVHGFCYACFVHVVGAVECLSITLMKKKECLPIPPKKEKTLSIFFT